MIHSSLSTSLYYFWNLQLQQVPQIATPRIITISVSRSSTGIVTAVIELKTVWHWQSEILHLPTRFITVNFLYMIHFAIVSGVFYSVECIFVCLLKFASLSNSTKTPSNHSTEYAFDSLVFGGLNPEPKGAGITSGTTTGTDITGSASFSSTEAPTTRFRNIRQHLLSFRNLSGSVEYFLQFTRNSRFNRFINSAAIFLPWKRTYF